MPLRAGAAASPREETPVARYLQDSGVESGIREVFSGDHEFPRQTGRQPRESR
jgi:hypothetical protein